MKYTRAYLVRRHWAYVWYSLHSLLWCWISFFILSFRFYVESSKNELRKMVFNEKYTLLVNTLLYISNFFLLFCNDWLNMKSVKWQKNVHDIQFDMNKSSLNYQLAPLEKHLIDSSKNSSHQMRCDVMKLIMIFIISVCPLKIHTFIYLRVVFSQNWRHHYIDI